ncbi:CDP-diacylglycerol--glycerol-3-phosphate 3-phosphatidyltransferase [Anaerococcus prevotii]|uniref:CDP-diacylglycerol--glycerol-3-phosphate 3-phosphatidyltransferase n=1 Tax=Anaerococcus prevotii (strain ATCC 9321 / DSM 20548 / JCM 6508 / NCTC 11806 / PC1) TaxID=525919 RepID=C7RGP8_ANAPD|nr:CDP-diacylglycerol--glycerol-3-phosphate 3-phosphatidyltransferase [Anaerococcus prevotii]ACV28659.1 CDP-diacylglycerol/glycerol-3-phosphate3-phosphatidyl transferase [Anaerococcus prevotii DSM 20548]SUU94221.1 CDP-diacylglycerol--glycerol-3-phosphate 3-phosphatidyltransferase [Anaerococcus prevotii]
MNLANKITLVRLFLIPVFVIIFMISGRDMNIAAIVFIIASLTDAVDGHIARSRNMITNFGKFTDPLVDKVLTMAAFLVLVEDNTIPAWPVIIIISRELIITGFRTLAADSGITIAASMWGKAKTTSQMISLVMLLLNVPSLNKAGIFVFYIAVILTVVSGVDYIVKNKKVLDLENI